MKTGTLVRFKPEYDGYFSNLKGKTLMINQVFRGDSRDPDTKVTLMHIDEIHLINASHLEVVREVTELN